MKRALKWTAGLLLVAVAGGFMAFLYFIPPLTTIRPDEFIKAEGAAPPNLDGVSDPRVRAIAEHGRYLVLTAGCADCHVTPGPRGPRWDRYMAGGMKEITPQGVAVTRNLTPDKETGIGARTDAELMHVLRSGVFHDGRAMDYRAMPWASFSTMTDEDLYAVIVFLRQLKPLAHRIPDLQPGRPSDPNAVEVVYGGQDYGAPAEKR